MSALRGDGEPGRCFVPTDLDEMAELLARARRERTAIEILGGGTQVVPAFDKPPTMGVSTLGWEGVDVFEPEEGVVHVRAGTTVRQVQETVEKEGWELPLDPLRTVSTVGGTIATAYAGPRAQAFGRVADALLGVEVLGADGELRKCGGRVVKNVTGYDLGKLYCGSYGTLGILTGAWLRLRPAPAERLAFRAAPPTDAESFERVRAWRDLSTLRVLTLMANETGDTRSIAEEADSLYIELGGSVAEVAADRHAIERTGALEAVPLDSIDRLGRWRASAREPANAPALSESVSFQVSVLGSRLADFVRQLLDRGFSLSSDLGLGVVFGSGRFDTFAEFIDLRRQAEAAGGFLSIRSMPDTWRSDVDALAIRSAERVFMEKIRMQFDPEGLLNPHVLRTHRADSPESA